MMKNSKLKFSEHMHISRSKSFGNLFSYYFWALQIDKFDNLFQKNGICSTAEYVLGQDNIVKVLNKQITNNQYDSIDHPLLALFS